MKSSAGIAGMISLRGHVAIRERRPRLKPTHPNAPYMLPGAFPALRRSAWASRNRLTLRASAKQRARARYRFSSGRRSGGRPPQAVGEYSLGSYSESLAAVLYSRDKVAAELGSVEVNGSQVDNTLHLAPVRSFKPCILALVRL